MGNMRRQKVPAMDFSRQRHKTILLGKHQVQDLSLVESFAVFKSYGCVCVCVLSICRRDSIKVPQVVSLRVGSAEPVSCCWLRQVKQED